MQHDPGTFRWTEQRERAAEMLAEDRLSDEQIATALGLERTILWRWRQHPDFKARVQEHITAQREAIMRDGIADRVQRVAALNDRWQRMQRIIEARAAEEIPEHLAHIYGTMPGYETGLLVRQFKHVADSLVVELAVDTGLLREMREHEKQTAQELGQWTEKREHSGEIGVRRYFGVSIDDV